MANKLGRLVHNAIATGCLVLVLSVLTEASPGHAITVTCQDEILRSNPLVQQAINDLARRESISPAHIELVSFEEVVWPDSSLGCPHPGMRYRQVPEDGAKIVLRFSGGERVYHSGGSRPPFWCRRGKRSLQTERQGVNSRPTET